MFTEDWPDFEKLWRRTMVEDRSIRAHPSQEQLDAAAVGDAVPEDVIAHLSTCARCRRDVDALTRVVAALAEPIVLEDPPEDLWERIRRELEETPADDAPTQDPSARSEPRDRRGSAPERSHSAVPHDELDGRRGRRRWRVTAVAAAAGIVLGAGGAAMIGGMFGEPEELEPSAPPPVAMVGEAVLVPATQDDVQGTARMVVSDADGEQLVVSVSDLPADGYYEVWLRDEAASRLISLGTVSSTTTTLPVPPGVDLSRFPIVDVSQERFDGDPSHSGVTVAAGPMIVQDGEE